MITMSSSCKYIWIDGSTYKIFKTFEPQQVQEYGIHLMENIYKKTLKVPIVYGAALKEGQYRNYIQEIKQGNVELTISPNSIENTMVTISSDEENKIAQSVFHLLRLVNNIRNGLPAKQFLAVPALNEEIKHNFQQFKEDVLKLHCDGVDDSIFQKESKLHFSINIFSLINEQEIDAAKGALIDCKNTVIMPLIKDKLPLKLDIRGIDCMQGNHSKVRVLYAKAKIVNDNEGFNFQMLLDKINEYFNQRGLTKDSRNEQVKIHMTLINTKYRKTKSGSKRPLGKNIPINATNIFSKYKDYNFGQSDLNSIHLCLISSSVDGGYYKILTDIAW